MLRREILVYPIMDAGRKRYTAENRNLKIHGSSDTRDGAVKDFILTAVSFGLSGNQADYDIKNVDKYPDDMPPTPTASQLVT